MESDDNLMIKPVNIKIINWNPIGIWTYDLLNEGHECILCRNKLTNKCVACNMKNNSSCFITKGVCGHGFHKDCLTAWISDKIDTSCPICKTKWTYDKNVSV